MKIEKLCVSFENKRVLRDFSAEIEGLTCVAGPSGCGKTTLLRTIVGLISPDSGRILGRPERISFMFQEDRLFPWMTALENVCAVMEKKDPQRAVKLLAAVELENEINSYPNELSGGMQRRVALARTLAYDGDMMILDEPFKGMDPPLVERLVHLINKSAIPVIVSTHSAEERALLGGRLLEMKKND